MLSLSFRFFLLILVAAITACSDEEAQPLPINDELSKMTPQERQAKAPTQAFEAVYRRDPEAVQNLIDENPMQFVQKNDYGLNAFMVAASLREKQSALIIAQGLPIGDLQDRDPEGRGYISYAAEAGFVDVIDEIAEKYKESLSWGLARFYNIDFQDNHGRHALFYAADAAVAKTLKNYWMQWSVTWSMSQTFLSGFYNTVDDEDQNFLHHAAATNRFDLLQWGVNEVCGPKYFEETDFWIDAPWALGQLGDWVVNGLQTLPLMPDMINHADYEGNNPLHLSARQGHWEASNLLMSCRNTQFNNENLFGRNPLSEMLASLDRNQEKIPDNYKKIFDQLLVKENRFAIWARSFTSNMVDAEDIDGCTSLHYAAYLKDPYFYEKLQSLGDAYWDSGLCGGAPQTIFAGRQGQ